MHKLLAIGALLTLSLSACGGPSTSGSAGTSSTGGASAAAQSTGAALSVVDTSLGKVLADAQGRTVYLLTADSAHHSTCDTSCLAYWPAVTAKSPPHRMAGVGAPVATTPVAGGGTTVTVGRWPVYTFVQDAGPGDVKGEGVNMFGGVWYAVSPSGQPVKSAGSSAGSSAPATPGVRGGY